MASGAEDGLVLGLTLGAEDGLVLGLTLGAEDGLALGLTLGAEDVLALGLTLCGLYLVLNGCRLRCYDGQMLYLLVFLQYCYIHIRAT